MAKKSVVARQKKRERMVKKYAVTRADIKKRARDVNLTDEERWEARQQLQNLPRDASPVRLRNRCKATGRPRGVYRKFGLGRNMLRILALHGDVPGMVKSSW